MHYSKSYTHTRVRHYSNFSPGAGFQSHEWSGCLATRTSSTSWNHYATRNRPLRIQDSNLNYMAMPAEPSPDQNAASHPHQDHESTHTVLHYGVIMLQVCIDSNSPEKPQNQSTASESTLNYPNIVYASSGYDPRARR